MKYVMAFGGSRRGPARLEDGVTRESVAAECRAAALELMSGIASGWRKIELARWLTGPYAEATRHCQRGERTLVADESTRGRVSVDPESIDELLTTTRARMLMALEKAALSDGALELAEEVIARGFVRRAVTEEGTEVWIPVDGARMRLQDRVSALFAADYLNDPIGYRALYVCHRCERVVFDEGARQIGMCSAHRRTSGIVVREEDEKAARDVAGA